MSFRCILQIDPSALAPRAGKRLLSQVSPLRFETENECLAFGRAIFEPPRSVLEWEVEEVTEAANYKYHKGRLMPLQ